MTTTQPAAMYLRVSTDQQTLENQRADLLRLAQARGFSVTAYEEIESAAKRRPVFDRMMDDARAGRVRAVVVWALDRVHRSMTGAINTVLELDRLGVQVVSLREPWLDTAGPVRDLLIAIFGWVAQQERERLRERTRAGLQRARSEGKRIGRPPSSPIALTAAAELVRVGGYSIRRAAAEWKIGASTLADHLRRTADCADNGTPATPAGDAK